MRQQPFVLVLLITACASSPKPVAPSPAPAPTPATTPAAVASPSASVVDAADRDAADRALDAGRKPALLLAFIGVKPGMRVGEIGSGGGYTAELLARSVGDTGAVYAVNNKLILEKFAAKPWAERLAKPVMKNVVRLDRDFDDPFPADVSGLDVVIINLFYHDTVWMNVDRAKMNAAVFRALKPGGVYVVVDHSAQPGHGVADVQTFHRIEESTVVSEVTAAGFVKEASADFLRNPSDTRDWNDSPKAAGDKRGTSDRFVLRFHKK